MESDSKQACLNRLKRIEGQIRGITGMVENDRYCIDVMTQVRAVAAALKQVEQLVLKDHMAHCVQHAIQSGDAEEQRRKIAELTALLTKL